jgi:hypothetical protein
VRPPFESCGKLAQEIREPLNIENKLIVRLTSREEVGRDIFSSKFKDDVGSGGSPWERQLVKLVNTCCKAKDSVSQRFETLLAVFGDLLHLAIEWRLLRGYVGGRKLDEMCFD